MEWKLDELQLNYTGGKMLVKFQAGIENMSLKFSG